MKKICFFLVLFGFLLSADVHAVKLTFSDERGYYNGPISLQLSADNPAATIRYTTNLSKPSTTNGTVYNNGDIISISSTTIVKAFAWDALDSTKVHTHTYIYLPEIVNSNYMSSHITGSASYASQLIPAFLELPAVSLSSDFYTANSNVDADVETAIEMWFPDNETAFNENCGVQTWGGSPSNPKKSYRLEFKDEYGVKKLKYKVFENDGNDYGVAPDNTFNKLLLRAGSQDGLNGEFCNEERAQFIRNRFIFDRFMDLGYPAPHGRFVHVFINGEYEGQYHLLERPDEDFFESYYSEDADLYEVRKSNTYWNEPVSPTFFSYLETEYDNSDYMDQKQTADYVVIHDFIGNFDWGMTHNNLGGALPTAGKGGYKFIPWDVDLIMGNVGSFTSYSPHVAYNSYNRKGPIEADWYSDTDGRYFIADAMECLCYNQGPFTATKLSEEYLELADKVELSLVAEAARWGDVNASLDQNIDQVPDWDPQDEWVTERDAVINDFIQNRLFYMEGYYNNAGITPGTSPVQYSQYGGVVPSGFGLTLSGPGTIYYTLDGSDPRTAGGGLAPSALVYAGPIFVNQPTIVSARSWNNGTWSAMCPRKFYPDQNYQELVINEIHYNPLDSITPNDTLDGDSFEFIEIKNNGASDIYLSDIRFNEGIAYTFPFDALLPAGDFAVIAEDSLLFIARYGFSPDGQYSGKLDNGGETISLIDPQKALIDLVSYEDDLPWDTIPDGSGPSLGLRDASMPNDIASAWGEQYVWYTPNEENKFCVPAIITTSKTDQLCSGIADGTATVNFSGGTLPVSHFWSNGAVGATVSGLTPGTYIVTTVDGTDCTYSDTITIGAMTALSMSESITDPLCFGIDDGEISLNSVGGTSPYSYSWSDGQSGSMASNLAPGNYTVTLTDINGCQKVESYTVANTPAELSIAHTNTDPLCFGVDDGTINATVSGGTSPFTYTWSNGASGSSLANLAPGQYILTVEDANSCIKTKTISIANPPALLNFNASIAQPLCDGVDDGEISTSLSGGASPYIYDWSDGQTGATATGLAPGNYTLIVEDSNGCIEQENFVIQPPTNFLSVTGIAVTETTFGAMDGSISISTLGPNVTSYSWSNGATTQNVSNLAAGTYTVTLTDSDGCTTTASWSLVAGPMFPVAAATFTPNFSVAPATVSFNGSGSIDPDGSIVAYDWDFGDGNTGTGIAPSHNYTSPGTYTASLITTDGQGLTDTIYLIVSVIDTCDPPTNLTLLTASATTLIVSWTGDPEATSYNLRYRDAAIGGSWTDVPTSGTTAILTGLNDCTDYELKVSNQCTYNLQSGYSSTEIFSTTNCFVCTAPVGLYQFNVQNISAIITWDVLVGATSYTYKFRKVGDPVWISETTTFPIAVLFGISGCADYEWTLETTCYDGSIAQSPTINYFSTLCKSDADLLEDDDYESNLKVFPNPASEYINISSSYFDSQNLEIRNLNGQLIWSSSEVELPLSLNVAQWNSGLYSVSDGKSSTLFIVE